MKKLALIALSFIIVLGTMTNALTYISFKFNQNEISKTLCVLRTQTNNTCNGRCVLAAKIKELNDLEKKHSASIFEKQDIVYVVSNQYFSNLFLRPPFFKSKITSFSESQNPKNISLILFRPPIV